MSDPGFAPAARAVCDTFVATAPVDGAAFTQMTSDMVRDTWCSSDAVVAELDQAQYELGEGPTQDAFAGRRAVLVADLAATRWLERWPAFVRRASPLEVGALLAIPMQVGAITAGVCLAYRRLPGALSAAEITDLLRAVDAATLALLALRAQPGSASDGLQGTFPRTVHQATGMVAAQLGVDIETAFARLRAYAYVEDLTLDQVAAQIVDRRLRLSRDPPDPSQSFR